MKIIITKDDVVEEVRFDDIRNCPLAKAMQRTLNDPNIIVGCTVIGRRNSMLGRISPEFDYKDFDNLVSGRIEEFVTEYTPI